MNNLLVATSALLLISCATAQRNGQPLSPADVSELYGQLNDARAALPTLAPEDRQAIAAAIDKTEVAIRHLADVAARGQNRQAIDNFLRAVVSVAVGSTVAGIAVDDVIVLPIAALALLAARVLTDAPAPPAELATAWESVKVGLNEISIAVAAARKKAPPFSRKQCQRHYNACLMTRLADHRWSGKSACQHCFDFCTGQGVWPLSLAVGQDCRWWLYRTP